MRHHHLILIARAQWRVAFVLFLLAAALAVWLMGTSNTPRPIYCGTVPAAVDSTVAQRWEEYEYRRLIPLRTRYGADVDLRRGERLFKTECASCHKLDKDMTGPALKYALQHAPSPTWFGTFLTAQDSLLRIRDPYTTALHAKWGNTPWLHPNKLSTSDINDLMAWLEHDDPRPIHVYSRR